jgi:hypothetical protein
MPRYTGARPVYSGRVDDKLVVNTRGSDTPIQVQEAFASAMAGLFPPLPGSISELRTALGGTTKAAAAITTIPEGATEEKRKILLRNSERRIQRYIVAEEGHGAIGGRQARGTNVANREKLRETLQGILAPRLRDATDAQIERDGVALNATGSLRVAPDYTEGRHIHWLLEGKYWGGENGILTAWRAGKQQLAARRFNRAFGASYGLPAARWSYLNELTFEPPN